MKSLMFLLIVTAAYAQEKGTINLKDFSNPKKYARTDTTLTVGNHSYQLVNIRPLQPGDTSCISAVVIDKRKLVFFDMLGSSVPRGIMVPREQPIKDALIVLKGSPLDSKTIILFAKGKLVALPGSDILVDQAGNSLYCVWDNDGTWRLTVFDFRSMKVVFPTAIIPKPAQWYAGIMDFWFKAADEKSFYKVEILSKSIVKNDKLEADAEPVSYVAGFRQTELKECCGKIVK